MKTFPTFPGPPLAAGVPVAAVERRAGDFSGRAAQAFLTPDACAAHQRSDSP